MSYKTKRGTFFALKPRPQLAPQLESKEEKRRREYMEIAGLAISEIIEVIKKDNKNFKN